MHLLFSSNFDWQSYLKLSKDESEELVDAINNRLRSKLTKAFSGNVNGPLKLECSGNRSFGPLSATTVSPSDEETDSEYEKKSSISKRKDHDQNSEPKSPPKKRGKVANESNSPKGKNQEVGNEISEGAKDGSRPESSDTQTQKKSSLRQACKNIKDKRATMGLNNTNV